MENELKNDQNHIVGSLRNLIQEVISRNVSILQVTNTNTGVINFSDKDCLWIEKLAQASLINNEDQYFITSSSRLMFDFGYVQSQIIRTYLLYCRIDYNHIIQRYQCHVNRMKSTTDNEPLDLDEKYLIRFSDEQLNNEWNYLKDMLLDKLYDTHKLLRQIALTLKNRKEDFSSNYFFEFVRMTDKENEILRRLEQYEIKDFKLCYISHVIEIYSESVKGFQHLFTDISPVLRTRIDPQLNDELIKKLNENITNIDYNNDTDRIQEKIQIITNLLNELKAIEDTLHQQSTQSLILICQYLEIQSPILSWLPCAIKCENYVDLYIHLMRTRSKLQEKKFTIEEEKMKLWDENSNSDEQQDKQSSRLNQYLNQHDSEQVSKETENNESERWKIPASDTFPSTPDITMDEKGLSDNYQFQAQPSIDSNDLPDENIQCTSLMTLDFKTVPCTSSVLSEAIHQYREEPLKEQITVTRPQKYIIILPSEESKSYLWWTKNICEQFKKLFNDKTYQLDLYVVVDKNEMFFDFTKNDYQLADPSILEYHIIEKQLLIQIQIHFRQEIIEYSTTAKCNFSTIIRRFIDDKQLRSLSSDIILCFFDEYGKCINNGTVNDLCKPHCKTISIFVTEEPLNGNTLYELGLHNKKGN